MFPVSKYAILKGFSVLGGCRPLTCASGLVEALARSKILLAYPFKGLYTPIYKNTNKIEYLDRGNLIGGNL